VHTENFYLKCRTKGYVNLQDSIKATWSTKPGPPTPHPWPGEHFTSKTRNIWHLSVAFVIESIIARSVTGVGRVRGG